MLDYMQEGINGIDISPEMVSKANENADTLGLELNLYFQAIQSYDFLVTIKPSLCRLLCSFT